MKIELKQGPNLINPGQSQAAEPQLSARQRAIAKLMTGAPESAVKEAQTPASYEDVAAQLSSNPSSAQNQAEVSQTVINDSEQSPVVESAEAQKAPEAKEDPLSTQYALLARKEKALRAKVQQQEAATKTREQALIAREEALKAKEAEYQTNYISKSRIKSDPMAVLAEEGVSYDELTKAILNPQAQQDPRIVAEIEKLKAEIKASKDYQEQAKRSYEEQQKQAYQQAVNQIRTEAKQLIQSDANFETIRETNSVNDVVELIERTYNEDGVLLSVEEAALKVEEYLVDEAMKLARIGKIKSKLQASGAPKQSEVKQTPEQQPKQQQSQMKTLTNSVNASKKLSTRERAILAFKNELK